MKRLLALVIAVAFFAGVIGCSGTATTAPKAPPKTDHGTPPPTRDTGSHVTPSHTGPALPPPSTGPSLPPPPTHKDTGKGETKK